MKKRSVFLGLCLLFATFVAQAQSVKDGLKLLEMEQYSKAKKVFSDLFNQNATAENAFYRGFYHLEVSQIDTTDFDNIKEQLDSAKIFFEKGLALDANFALNHVGLGALAMINKDKAKAQAYFDKAIALSKSKNAEVLYRIAEALISYKVTDLNQAITLLEKAHKIDKQNTDILLAWGDALIMRNNIAQNDAGNGAKKYDQALIINPKLAKAYIRLGDIYKRARNYNGALEKYNEGIKVDPQFSPIYRQLGNLYFLAKDYKRAIEAYKKYISLSDHNPETMFRYAGFLYLNKDYEESLSELKKLVGVIKNPVIYRLMAYCEQELKQCESGVKNIETFFDKVNPERIISQDYEYLGKLLICSGKDTLKGAENLRKVADMETDVNKALAIRRDLASMFFRAKKYNLAAQEYAMLISKTDKPASADLFEMGRSYYFDKNFKKADETFAKFSELNPDNPYGYYWRGLSSYRLDTEYKEGLCVPYFEKFIAIVKPEEKEKYKKDIVSSYTYLLGFHMKKDNREKSLEMCKKILEIDPENKRGRETLKLLEGK
ncbi:MAG: tetratricopeptide repeat protein [Microscillaceae bacterium]|nr:tetratricopeptide repeat protein [Microscillaceae bacterium]MDW8460447.1 tetratricopeptide repeat protein [Cytophagales bacterium]